MSQNQNPKDSEAQPASQQQSIGDVQVQGDDNIFNVIQAEIVTLTQTKIIQISVDEIKTRELITTSPYKGLKKFEPEDTNRFFGRDQFIGGLVNDLEHTSFILLLGASGSGKSSVVRAGLIPWFQQKWGKHFVSLMFTPDRDPFEALYGSLLSRGYRQSQAQVAKAAKAETLSQVVKTLKPPESFWLIFIDQFEELFTVSEDDKRDHFIDSLIKLSQTSPTSVQIVATMRADFLDRLSPYPKLVKVTDRHRPLIAEMQMDELRLAIEQPAAHHGLVFETGLVEEIISAVQGQAGCLPLLQYTLDLLWESEVQDGGINDRTLNITSYRQLGGVRGALQQRVDQIYAGLSQSEQLAAQRIFLKLVEIGGDAESGTEWKPVRRRALRSEFTDEQEQTVLMQLIDQNLLVSDAIVQTDGTAPVSTVEIAHEILLTSWSRLHDWIQGNRLSITLRNRLNHDVVLWQAKKADNDLWSGSKLAQVVELRRDPVFKQVLGGFSDPANQFIDASVGLRDRQRRRVLLGLSGFSIMALTLACFALYQLQQAERQRMEQLVATAEAMLVTDPVEAEINAIAVMGLSQSAIVQFPNHSIPRSVYNTLMEVVQVNQEQNQLKLEWFIRCIALSPDGKTLVGGGEDNMLYRWDASTGQPIGNPLKGHTDWVTAVAFSPDSRRIVSGSADQTLRLWDASTGQPIGNPLKGHTDWVTAVAFSPDGKRIVSSSYDNTVRLWKTLAGHLVGTPLKGHQDTVESVAFSLDGKTIASGSYDTTIRLWNAVTGKPIGNPLKGHTQKVWSVAFSPDGKRLVSGSDDETIRLWNTKTGQPIGNPLTGHEGLVTSAAFSQDGKQIVSGSRDRTVRLWDVLTGQQIGKTFYGPTSMVRSVAFSHDSKRIVSISDDQTVRLWNALIGPPSPIAHIGEVNSIAFSRDSKRIINGSSETIRLGDVSTGKPIGKPLEGHTEEITSVAISADGKRIVSGSFDKTVRLWNISSGKSISNTFTGHTDTVTSVAFSPDGRTIASGSNDKTIRLWNALTKQPIGVPFSHPGWVSSVAFNSDGKTIASGSYDMAVRLWNVKTGKLIGKPLTGHMGEVISVAFSPDGKTIASGSRDKTIRLWDVSTGQPIGNPLIGHSEEVSSVAFSPDGKTIASGSNDMTVRLWDVSTGQLIGNPLTGPTNWVTSVAFSPDGRYVASGNKDSTVRFWAVDWAVNWQDLLTTACTQLEHHSSLKNPKTKVATEARAICQQYVWSKSDSISKQLL